MTRMRNGGHRQPRAGRLATATRDDRGAASIEHAGMVVLVGGLLAAAVAAPASDVIGSQVAYRICQAFEKLPMDGGGCTSPALDDRLDTLASDCLISQTDRNLRVSGSFKIVRAERETTDQIQINADGSASVRLSEGGGVGLTTPSRPDVDGVDDGPGVDWNAHATVSGDLQYHYNFPTEYGGEGSAQDFLDSRRGNVGLEIAQTVVPGAQTVQEGATRLGNGIASGFRSITGESEEEAAARRQSDAMETADSVSVAFSLSGLASVSGDAHLVEGEVSADGEVQGTVTTSLNTDGPDAGSNKFEGSAQYNVGAEVNLGVPGDPARGIGDLPPFLNLNGEYGQTGSYSVTYDEHGEPAVLEVAVETRTSGGGGLAPEVGPVEGDGGAEVGTVTRERRLLDLTDPDNQAAYDAFFVDVGLDVDGHSAKAAVPRPAPVGSPEFAERMGQAVTLWERTEQDALVINEEYSMSGTGIGAEATNDRGIDAGVARVGGSRNATTLELTEATVQDNRTGGAAQPLATCEG